MEEKVDYPDMLTPAKDMAASDIFNDCQLFSHH
jgi:hypothetical protein